MTRTIDVSDLPAPLVAAIESMLITYRANTRQATSVRAAPPMGWLKGRWELPDSFFEPLPDDLLDLFHGNSLTSGGGSDKRGAES